MSGINPKNLLNQLEDTLDSDPLIDEVGFVHPSQFLTLDKEGLLRPDVSSESVFWCRDHKLAISTDVLFPLYKCVRHAFMTTLGRYKEESFSSSSALGLESEIMKHSKALLLLSSDFGTAWNSRKIVLSKDGNLQRLVDELFFSALVLSNWPKSDRSWSHRKWVIEMIAGKSMNLQEMVNKESELVESIVEKSKMNYRAWNHRCWLVSYMSSKQVLHELKKSRGWTKLHLADNSAFHYRVRLMLRMLEKSWHNQDLDASLGIEEICEVWKEELDWNKVLIKQYIGRESLWLHRRFLSVCWIKHFASEDCIQLRNSDQKAAIKNETDAFLHNEFEFFRACSSIPDNTFEDFQAQAMFSATYILWLAKQISETVEIELEEKLGLGEVKKVIGSICPEKIFLC